MITPVSLPAQPDLTLVSDSQPPAPRPLPGRIYTPLPRAWIGIPLAVLCLVIQMFGDQYDVFVWLVSMIGTCYWLFCVHRIHKVLAEFSNGSYPMSARRSVGFHLIPVFEYYWFFRWTRQLARFFDEQSGISDTPKVWPGIILAAASILGWFPDFKALRLFVLFSFALYLNHKLHRALPACQPIPIRRADQWNLSLSAAVGAIFTFILVEALQKENLQEVLTAFLVSFVMLLFLEPVLERLRVVLRIADDHPVVRARNSWHLRFVVFFVLLTTNVFHSALEAGIDEVLGNTKIGTVLLAGLLVSGGITFFWIAAAHHRPSHAARSGLVSGLVLGFVVAGVILSTSVGGRKEQLHTRNKPLFNSPLGVFSAGVVNDLEEHRFASAVVHGFPLVPERVIHDVEDNNRTGLGVLTDIMLMALPWPIFGLAGGLAIDRRWGGKVHSVGLSMCAVAVLYTVILWLSNQLRVGGEMLSHVSVAAGWGLALSVCPCSGILMPSDAAPELARQT